MKFEVTFAGFGGQGIMMIGKIFAYAAMMEGYEVIWLPSYGPEMRGGTANCVVVVSDKSIGSPIITNPLSAVIMNNPSLEKFGYALKPGGFAIINTSLINIPLKRDDITKIEIPANAMARDLGNGKAANMIVLGALIGRNSLVSYKNIEHLITDQFKGKPAFIDLNLRAIQQGYEAAQKAS
jgi:2-oxoglutarate ferredoxin oxidoreductase subunit gamma